MKLHRVYRTSLSLSLSLSLALIAALPGPLALAQARPQTPDAKMPAMPEFNAMPGTEASRSVVNGQGVTLDASFAYDASAKKIAVRYRVRNIGDMPSAVFDRGNRQAVLTKRQALGAIAPPRFEDDGGDTTLSHIAAPLSKPAPTVPPVPLAILIAPGAEAGGEFEFAFASATPKRVRWCLGTASFDDADFSSPERGGGVEVWRASFAVVERQQVLCTPWFDLARGTFVAER